MTRRAVISASFDLDELRAARDNWFVFRDRRPGPVRAARQLQLEPIYLQSRTIAKIYFHERDRHAVRDQSSK